MSGILYRSEIDGFNYICENIRIIQTTSSTCSQAGCAMRTASPRGQTVQLIPAEVTPSARSLILKKRSNAGRLSHLWYLVECPESAESSLYRAPADGLKEVWVQLVSGTNGGVLSASMVEEPRNRQAGQDLFEVAVQPDIGGQHQYWRRDESGRFISAHGVNAVNNASELLLSVDDKSGRVIATAVMTD